jgi:cytosine/adenosine deaminase-related metal-dependent hydrolase
MPTSAENGRESCDLLIRNARVLTLDADRTVYPSGAVAISGRDIAAVGTESDILGRYRADRVLDARGALVHPGFVESHYHTGLHTTRGAVSDEPHAVSPSGGSDGQIGLYSAWFNHQSDEDEFANALLACVEMVRNGITCFLEPGTALETDAVAAAATAVGIRASLCDPFIWDHAEGLSMASEIERAPVGLERSLDVLGTELRRNADSDALVRGHVGLYGMSTFTDELAIAAKRCADDNGVVLTLHQNFEIGDTEYDDRRWGRHAVDHLGEIGVLGPNTTLAHMNVLRDGEIDALAGSGSAVVWHPGNFLFYGIAATVPNRMPELADRGIPLGFMTDAAKAWSFGEMAWAAYLAARMGGDYLSSERLLEMQTLGGARAVGLADRIGSLEPGKRADLVIRTDDLPEAHPGIDLVRAAMLISRSKSVDTVVIDGVIVVRGGRLTRLDEGVAYDLARRSTERLCGELGLESPATWPEVR